MRVLRRWGAAVAVAAMAGAFVAAGPAWAADKVEIKVEGSVQVKAGEDIPVRYEINNDTKVNLAADDVAVTVRVPANATFNAAKSPNCQAGAGGQGAVCRPGAVAAGRKLTAGFVVTGKTAGQGAGGVQLKPGNSSANFVVRVVGGPTPTASGKSPSAKASASKSAGAEPPGATEEAAPPVAGNGVNPEALTTTDTAKQNASESSGLGLGVWVGIIAIVGALALIGSLFYFRHKDKNEPDTGMHPIVPMPPGGFPSGRPATYGNPQPYGTPEPYGNQQPYGTQQR